MANIVRIKGGHASVITKLKNEINENDLMDDATARIYLDKVEKTFIKFEEAHHEVMEMVEDDQVAATQEQHLKVVQDVEWMRKTLDKVISKSYKNDNQTHQNTLPPKAIIINGSELAEPNCSERSVHSKRSARSRKSLRSHRSSHKQRSVHSQSPASSKLSASSQVSSSSRFLKAKTEQAKEKLKLQELKAQQEMDRQEEEMKRKQKVIQQRREQEEEQMKRRREQEEEEMKRQQREIQRQKEMLAAERKLKEAELDAKLEEELMQEEGSILGYSISDSISTTTKTVANILETLNQTQDELPSRPQAVHLYDDLTNQRKDDQLYGMLSKTLMMPRPEILQFNGDSKNYTKFMHCFDTNIDKQLHDDGLKLNYLIQFCEGKAKEAIETCVIQNSSEGYRSARAILKRRFGLPHAIATAHMAMLTEGGNIKANDGEALTQLSMNMERCLITFEEMGYMTELNHRANLLSIVDRLPFHLRTKWVEAADKIIVTGKEPNFRDLTGFVERCARTSNSYYGKNIARQQTSSSTKVEKHLTLATSGKGTGERNECINCNAGHALQECETFQDMPYSQRKHFARQHRLCYNCFKPGHPNSKCFKESQCESKCNLPWKHDVLLHPPPKPEDDDKPTTDQESEQYGSCATTYLTEGHKRVLMRIVPVKVKSSGGPCISTYALLDDCSDVSLCDERLASTLGIRGKKRQFNISTVNESDSNMVGQEISLQVMPLEGSGSVTLDSVLTIKKLPISTNSIATQNDVKEWPHLRDITLPLISKSGLEVMLLIGSDTPEVFWTLDERRAGKKDPYAIQSVLGWSVIGPVDGRSSESRSVSVIHKQELQLKMVRKSESYDRLATRELVSSEDSVELMAEVVQVNENENMISLPWPEGYKNLTTKMKMEECGNTNLSPVKQMNDNITKEVIQKQGPRELVKQIDRTEHRDAKGTLSNSNATVNQQLSKQNTSTTQNMMLNAISRTNDGSTAANDKPVEQKSRKENAKQETTKTNRPTIPKQNARRSARSCTMTAMQGQGIERHQVFGIGSTNEQVVPRNEHEQREEKVIRPELWGRVRSWHGHG